MPLTLKPPEFFIPFQISYWNASTKYDRLRWFLLSEFQANENTKFTTIRDNQIYKEFLGERSGISITEY